MQLRRQPQLLLLLLPAGQRWALQQLLLLLLPASWPGAARILKPSPPAGHRLAHGLRP